MSIERAFFNIIAPDPRPVAEFYERLFGHRVLFRSDWFVHLAAEDDPKLELGILREDHELVPKTATAGGMITFVVPDVDVAHARAKERGVEIVEPPRDQFYGQRRMLLTDPAGTIVDVSSECAPDPEWLKRVRAAADGGHYED